MLIDEPLTVALATVALAAYLALVALRIRTDAQGSRVLFMDCLLAIAALEVLADTLGWRAVAEGAQGALMAGGFALLVTFRHDRRM